MTFHQATVQVAPLEVIYLSWIWSKDTSNISLNANSVEQEDSFAQALCFTLECRQLEVRQFLAIEIVFYFFLKGYFILKILKFFS